jgi:uncharacterized protein YjbI with pentapeptide repeats
MIIITINMHEIKPGVDLRGANLMCADIREANLKGTILEEVK